MEASNSINLELWLKIGAFVVSVLLLGKGIFEYTRAQKWKRAELIAKEMKEFLQDATIKRALLLLDWNIPDMNGTEVLAWVRNSLRSTVPVMVRLRVVWRMWKGRTARLARAGDARSAGMGVSGRGSAGGRSRPTTRSPASASTTART